MPAESKSLRFEETVDPGRPKGHQTVYRVFKNEDNSLIGEIRWGHWIVGDATIAKDGYLFFPRAGDIAFADAWITEVFLFMGILNVEDQQKERNDGREKITA